MQRFAAWIEAEQGRFFLILPIAMGTAILVYFDLKSEPPLWLGLCLATASALALAASWRLPPARFIAALALAASLGFARAEWRTAAMPPLLDVPFGSVIATGSISSIDNLPTGRRITLAPAALDGGPPLARVLRIKLSAHDTTMLAPGDVVALRAILFKPDRPAYPGGWDATRDAYFAGLGASGFELGTLTVTNPATGQGFSVWLRGVRENIAASINASLTPATASVAVTLLTGLENQMPPDERQQFIAAGLAHLLAVAGLHVGIVMGLFFAAARFCLTRHERIALHLPVKPIAACVALAAGGMYAALTGAHLPILRSLAMASLVTAGVIAGRRAISLRGLALAAMLILLSTPEAIIGVSFQMSFSAVLALVSGYAGAKTWFGGLRETSAPIARTSRHIAGLFFTSLLAGGASMPFAAYQFGQVQPYWILANLVAVPLTALWVMPAGLLALVLMPLHLAFLALVPMGWGIAIILWLTRTIATWPAAMLPVPPMPASAILLYAAGLVWVCIWRSGIRWAGLASVSLALCLYLTARPPDILVSSDARLIAVRTDAGPLLVRAPKASGYILSQWRPVWPGPAFTVFDTSTCAQASCQLSGQISVLLVNPATCPDSRVIIAAVPLRGLCDGANTLVVDRLSTYRDGATSIWLDGARWRRLTDRDIQGSRPWVPPWPTT